MIVPMAAAAPLLWIPFGAFCAVLAIALAAVLWSGGDDEPPL
jgi:hypothetical protein